MADPHIPTPPSDMSVFNQEQEKFIRDWTQHRRWGIIGQWITVFMAIVNIWFAAAAARDHQWLYAGMSGLWFLGCIGVGGFIRWVGIAWTVAATSRVQMMRSYDLAGQWHAAWLHATGRPAPSEE